MNKVLVYTKDPSPRFEYVIRHIEGYFNNLSLESCGELEVYLQWTGLSIQHGQEDLKLKEFKMNRSVHFDKTLDKLIEDGEDFLQTIHCSAEISQDFDLISAIFWHLSRIEEYFPIALDHHGRFPASKSILFKKNILHLPLVDLWIFEWAKKLEDFFGMSIHLKPQLTDWSVGIDVDQFYKHQHKPLFKKLGGCLKDLSSGKLTDVWERIQIYSGLIKDPYDTYEEVRKLNIPKSSLCYFILSGGQSPYDKNHSLRQKVILLKIKDLERFSEIGLHPSYESNRQSDLIKRELHTLQQCCSEPIVKSRQHYLRIGLPDTYRLLIEAGIQEDYSMGYAEQTGFRAACCRPFHWYDLQREQSTELIIVPFSLMDRTYLTYLKYQPSQAILDMQSLWDTCKKYQGHFHIIWHNSSFDFLGEWKNWDGVFEKMVTQLIDLPKNEDPTIKSRETSIRNL
ncbi:MAG: polysaccharide deacetylase family protein [Saprospiraceae bacterium]|nr:polysaccharide deacetylase family protein [Saprospiraceae bacterium]